MTKKVIVIGGGVAGMEAAASLSEMGFEVILLEKENKTGGHLRMWDHLFPDFRPAKEVQDFLEKRLNSRVTLHTSTVIKDISRENDLISIILSGGVKIDGHALLLATGFKEFDARKKEEYGYGIYDRVITSSELESLFSNGKNPVISNGKKPERIGFIHCVGSRDEKAGHLYCSKVCCATGIKQSIELKQRYPEADIFCFYMDLRMSDRHLEELYFEAQQKWGINFIRGRLSEAAENKDHSILIKVEDTLIGLPLKLTVDLLVLLVGFIPLPETAGLAAMIGITPGEDGFLMPLDEHIRQNWTMIPGVFLAGAIKGPTSIKETISDARAAAMQIANFLND